MTTATKARTLYVGTEPNPADRLQIDVDEEDNLKVKALKKVGAFVTVLDLRTNRLVTVKRANCGLDCACALELVEWMEESPTRAHTCIDIGNFTPTGLFCVACVEERKSVICSDCGIDHGHQRTDYPVNGRVKTLRPISIVAGERVPTGAWGTVKSHCNDGRAYVFFDGYNEGHTFHAPKEWIRLVSSEQSTQPATNTGEWIVERQFVLGYQIVDQTGRKVVGNIYREEDAEQIVSEHNAVAKLVAALEEVLRSGVEFDDPRMRYVVMQVDRDAIADANAALTTLRRDSERE